MKPGTARVIIVAFALGLAAGVGVGVAIGTDLARSEHDAMVRQTNRLMESRSMDGDYIADLQEQIDSLNCRVDHIVGRGWYIEHANRKVGR